MSEQSRPNPGVMTHRQIVERIKDGSLVKWPLASPHSVGELVSRAKGCSFDLTVGTIFWEEKILRESTSGEPVVVPPGGVVGIFTAEDMKLPYDVFATAFAINSMSSRGFLVLNPGHVDPGFEGPLSIKALNVRKTPISIQHGDPIFTVIFEQLGEETTRQYDNVSRADRERDFNSKSVEYSPRTLGALLTVDREWPFPTRDEVAQIVSRDFPKRTEIDNIIGKHWMSRIAFVASVVAALAALLALVLALLPGHVQLQGGSDQQRMVPTIESRCPTVPDVTVNAVPDACPSVPAKVESPPGRSQTQPKAQAPTKP
jgi:deoxycytidine triphosphate deaminase